MQNLFPSEWQKVLKNNKFEQFTEIQEKSYPVLEKGKNALLLSPTGTGKTLAYIWPLLKKVRPEIRNQFVIVAPTQELAMQIVKVAREWAKPLNLNVAQLIGGANINRQIDKLKKHPEIVVGTPGRLIELMNRRKVRADYVSMMVFDEFDLLLKNRADINFAIQLLKKVKKDTQIVGVSATLYDEEIVSILPEDLEVIDVMKEKENKRNVTEYYLETPMRKRTEILRKLAYTPEFHAIVFFNSVSELGAVADKLSYEGIPISTLASDESKFERQMSLAAFSRRQSSLLLTTDLGSRGLDIKGLNTVVNYDIPETKESYLHRMGRVGRMGNQGEIISLVTNHTLKDLKKIAFNKNDLEQIYVHHGELTTKAK